LVKIPTPARCATTGGVLLLCHGRSRDLRRWPHELAQGVSLDQFFAVDGYRFEPTGFAKLPQFRSAQAAHRLRVIV
jgi:hypothetical protein